MSSKTEYYTYGPSGGIGGNAFYVAWPPGAFKITRVWGKSGSRINQIGLDWSTVDGVESRRDELLFIMAAHATRFGDAKL